MLHRLFLASVLIVVGCSKGAGPGGLVGEQPDAAATVVPHPDATIQLTPDAKTVRTGFMCSQLPPANAPVPVPPPKFSGGTCPALVSGVNAITSGGVARSFILVLPKDMTSEEELPVLFMWYWIGGSAEDFLEKGEVQAAADQQRFIAVIPTAIGADVFPTTFNTKWPFDITQSAARMDQEFGFFDDMLGCVEHEYNVNQSCVSSVGVSAGALFNDQLAQARSETLASFISLSGGVNDTIIKPWAGAQRKLPGVVLWGGDGPPTMDGNKDILGCLGIGMDFSVASKDLEDALTADGHFFIECKHNCGHVEPPLVPLPGQSKYAAMWQFAMDHPFWLPTGTSPYQTEGLPAAMPPWCGIGANSCTPRSGSGCPAAENPCAF